MLSSEELQNKKLLNKGLFSMYLFLIPIAIFGYAIRSVDLFLCILSFVAIFLLTIYGIITKIMQIKRNYALPREYFSNYNRIFKSKIAKGFLVIALFLVIYLGANFFIAILALSILAIYTLYITKKIFLDEETITSLKINIIFCEFLMNKKTHIGFLLFAIGFLVPICGVLFGIQFENTYYYLLYVPFYLMNTVGEILLMLAILELY